MMIDARELRIGNKLQKDNGEIFTVLRLDNTNDILVEEQRGLLTLNYNLFGIKITEEWLVKFGFEVKTASLSHNFTYQKDFFTINNPLRGNISRVNIHVGDDKLLIDCKYVHQLQNLYFALKGEELKLK